MRNCYLEVSSRSLFFNMVIEACRLECYLFRITLQMRYITNTLQVRETGSKGSHVAKRRVTSPTGGDPKIRLALGLAKMKVCNGHDNS